MWVLIVIYFGVGSTPPSFFTVPGFSSAENCNRLGREAKLWLRPDAGSGNTMEVHCEQVN
jgi:hypothetical protein